MNKVSKAVDLYSTLHMTLTYKTPRYDTCWRGSQFYLPFTRLIHTWHDGCGCWCGCRGLGVQMDWISAAYASVWQGGLLPSCDREVVCRLSAWFCVAWQCGLASGEGQWVGTSAEWNGSGLVDVWCWADGFTCGGLGRETGSGWYNSKGAERWVGMAWACFIRGQGWLGEEFGWRLCDLEMV